MNPKSMVALSLLTSGVLIGASQLLNGKMPTYRQLVGVFVVYVFLGIGAEVTPEVAAAFSVLIVVVVFMETFGKTAPKLDAFFKGQNKQGYTGPMWKGH